MITLNQLTDLLYECLQLDSNQIKLVPDSPLLGAIPEFDSMGVLGVITELEERFGLEFEDEELSGELFETVESLMQFVNSKSP